MVSTFLYVFHESSKRVSILDREREAKPGRLRPTHASEFLFSIGKLGQISNWFLSMRFLSRDH